MKGEIYYFEVKDTYLQLLGWSYFFTWVQFNYSLVSVHLYCKTLGVLGFSILIRLNVRT